MEEMSQYVNNVDSIYISIALKLICKFFKSINNLNSTINFMWKLRTVT